MSLSSFQIPDLDDLWAYGGEYRAIAVNDYGQADCRSYVLLETPLRLRKPEMTKPAIAGRAYTIKCYFIGSGIPSVCFVHITFSLLLPFMKNWDLVKLSELFRASMTDLSHSQLSLPKVRSDLCRRLNCAGGLFRFSK